MGNCCQNAEGYSDLPGQQRASNERKSCFSNESLHRSSSYKEKLQEPKTFNNPKEKQLERVLESKDREMQFYDIDYNEFKTTIESIGSSGTVSLEQFRKSDLHEKYLSTQDLQAYSTRLSCYFNSDLLMIQDSSDNVDDRAVDGAHKKLTGVYRTHEVLILGFLFCKHPTIESRLDSFWELICPDKAQNVSLNLVISFLVSLQNISIDVPYLREQSEINQNQNLINYFKKMEQSKQKAIAKTMWLIQNEPEPFVFQDEQDSSVVKVTKEKLLEIVSENWLKTFLIRHYHIQIYDELKEANQIQDEIEYSESLKN